MCRYVDIRYVAPGWGCCHCTHKQSDKSWIYNGIERLNCKQCGHDRCALLRGKTEVERLQNEALAATQLIAWGCEQLLQAKPEDRAFLIIEADLTGKYVQFSGSNTQPLWFDAPQLGIVNNGPKFDAPSEAAAYAIKMLREAHDLPEGAALRISYHHTEDER